MLLPNGPLPISTLEVMGCRRFGSSLAMNTGTGTPGDDLDSSADFQPAGPVSQVVLKRHRLPCRSPKYMAAVERSPVRLGTRVTGPSPFGFEASEAGNLNLK